MTIEALLTRTFTGGEVAVIAAFALFLGMVLYRISGILYTFLPVLFTVSFAASAMFAVAEVTRHIYLANVKGGMEISPPYLNVTFDLMIGVASVIGVAISGFYTEEFFRSRFPGCFKN